MGILENAGRVLRDTVHAFRSELDRREPEDAVAELLTGMKREMVAGRERLHARRDALTELRGRLAREERAIRDCGRRAGQAARIGDGETERIAREWEARHAAEAGQLRKVAVERELDMRAAEDEAAARLEAYRTAERQRHALVAALRTAPPEARPGADEDPFAWLEGLVAVWQQGESTGEGARPGTDTRGPAPREGDRAIDERLEALKRQVGGE